MRLQLGAALAACAVMLAGCSGAIAGKPVAAPGPAALGALPKTIDDSINSPQAGPLAARVIGADPCELINLDAIKQFGPDPRPTEMVGFAACGYRIAAGPGQPSYKFELRLDSHIFENDLITRDFDRQIKREVSKLTTPAGYPLIKRQTSTDSGSCLTDYLLPYENTGFAASIYTAASAPADCAAIEKYVQSISDKILNLPARKDKPSGRSLIGRDPCNGKTQAAAAFSGWTMAKEIGHDGYQCILKFTGDSDVSYKVELEFERRVEQTGTRELNLAGLPGVAIISGNWCTVLLVYRPSSPPGSETAHLISAGVRPSTSAATSLPFDSCTKAERIAADIAVSLS